MKSVFGAAQFADAMENCLAGGAPWPGAVAVSGGGDSLALMLLLEEWTRTLKRPRPTVLTVDHGLSRGSEETAGGVIREAKRLGLDAHVLLWRGAKPKSDLEARAREARYTLMGKWCEEHDLRALYVAHTRDDQAETFLLRLARGSGLDGLAAMRAVSPYPVPKLEQLRIVRPLLGVRREELRNILASRGIKCSDDPMNSDPRFARVRLRQAWPVLESLGLSVERIAAASGHLARAREALEAETAEFLEKACRAETDRIVLDGPQLARVPPEIGLRALALILSRTSGVAYRPRFERLEKLYFAIRSGELKTARTLHGCRVGPAMKSAATFGPGSLVVTRERTLKKAKKPGIAATKQIS